MTFHFQRLKVSQPKFLTFQHKKPFATFNRAIEFLSQDHGGFQLLFTDQKCIEKGSSNGCFLLYKNGDFSCSSVDPVFYANLSFCIHLKFSIEDLPVHDFFSKTLFGLTVKNLNFWLRLCARILIQHLVLRAINNCT